MASVEHIAITVQDDFLERQTRAKPVAALAELIWNGLDGDATRVSVELEHNDLAGGLSKIVVYDNGIGFPRDKAAELFGNLGGSWKRHTRLTEKQRVVHGQEGRGRYKAFALGQSIEWSVCWRDGKTVKAFEINLRESDLKDVAISEPRPAPGRDPGVIVTITDIKRDFQIFKSDEAMDDGLQELAEIFALYLTNYADAVVELAGKRVDPKTAIATIERFNLSPITSSDGKSHQAELQVIEWRAQTQRTLYLCSKEGFPLEQLETRFHVASFNFSAHLKSPYISALYQEGRLGLAEMDTALSAATEEARQFIKEHFLKRAADRAQDVVDEWKADNVYPYEGIAETPVEQAERQIFDIVAVSVNEYAELHRTPPKTRALHLRMLRHAIEQSPTELQTILNEVLQLPKKQQAELADLLQETTLSAIITAAKTIADRLKFIAGLEAIVFDTEKRERLKERSQLHKILQENTWIFGEEYNLWVSDRSLSKVLREHKDKLDPNIVIDEPVMLETKKRGIVDLMLSTASRNHRPDDIDHLVVELKAPKVVIHSKEIQQIKEYALAVSKDARFRTVQGLRWHFWVISNELSDFAEEEIRGGPNARERLVHQTDSVSVGIKTWAEVIEDNRARLQFFQEHLQFNAKESDALAYLQQKHRKFLEGVLADDEPAESGEVDDQRKPVAAPRKKRTG